MVLQVSGFAWRNGYAVWLLEQLASAAALLVLAVPEGEVCVHGVGCFNKGPLP